MPSQRKGRKSRKAAKQQKANQAHKHREARQARRDRKSRRDVEAMGIALSDRGFHRFPNLPLELREMVWDKCIPSRVVFHGLDTYFDFNIGILRNQQRPPIISQVCREARGVALRHGSRITIGTLGIRSGRRRGDAHNPRGLRENAWFDTRRDTLLLCGERFRASWLSISNDAVAAIKTSGRLACQDNGQERIPDETTIDMLGLEWLQKADVAYIANKHHVLATPSEVIGSGLFGLFGESRAILVDLGDTETSDTPGRPRTGLTSTAISSGDKSPTMSFHNVAKFPLFLRTQIPDPYRAAWLSEKFRRCCEVSPKSRMLAVVLLDPEQGR